VPHVLEGLRVLDLTSGPVGGMATMVLADFGADVIKVEPPGGDRFRSLPASPLWLRGKRSIVLDLTTTAAIAQLHSLVASADVLVVSGPPSRAARWGVDADAAIALRPDLVHCSITGWGPRGALVDVPAYDGVVAARGGRMMAFERQLRRGGPVFAAVPVASHVTSHGAVHGIVAGLLARARHGGPQRVETSLLQGLLPFDLMELLVVELYERHGIVAPSVTSVGGDMPTLNYHPICTADGRWIQCGNLLEHLLMAFLDATDLLGEMLAEDRFTVAPGAWDADTVEAARDMILTRARQKTADEWMEIFRANGNVAAEPFLTTAEALHHPDVVANGDIVELDDPVHGKVRTIGPIAELTATPAVIGKPAPTVGEHTDEVLTSLDAQPTGRPVVATATATATATTTRRDRPLDGITIVEFATIIAAPLSTAMLADLGARVIRVEVTDGDPYRHLVAGGTTAAKTTAGKESICVDLKTAPGRRIARALALQADVLVHNYRPGVADRLGLGYDDLRAEHPALVWVSVAGYGRHSPSANRPATHPCAGAAMGGAGYQAAVALTVPCASLADIRETARQLMRANEANPDPNTSVVAASATLLALLARQRHGIGQAVYVNMLAANAYANADDALTYDSKPDRVAPDAELLGLGACYRLYPAADGWMFLAVTSDAEWQRFCDAVGRDDLAGEDRFATADARRVNNDELARQLEQVFVLRGANAWESILTGRRVAGVRADGPTPGPFFAHDADVLDNGFAPLCHHARFGDHRRWGPIVTINGGLDDYRAGVLAGEHTDALLTELGYDAAQIAELRAGNVVASEPIGWV